LRAGGSSANQKQGTSQSENRGENKKGTNPRAQMANPEIPKL
jgi:hypothetical protein